MELTDWMVRELKKEGIEISGVNYCPHTPEEGCDCRKPKPKMILDFTKYFDIDLKSSWLIGDKESDIEAGLNAGITNNILVRSGHKIDEENTKAKYIRDSAYDCIDLIR